MLIDITTIHQLTFTCMLITYYNVYSSGDKTGQILAIFRQWRRKPWMAISMNDQWLHVSKWKFSSTIMALSYLTDCLHSIIFSAITLQLSAHHNTDEFGRIVWGYFDDDKSRYIRALSIDTTLKVVLKQILWQQEWLSFAWTTKTCPITLTWFTITAAMPKRKLWRLLRVYILLIRWLTYATCKTEFAAHILLSHSPSLKGCSLLG